VAHEPLQQHLPGLAQGQPLGQVHVSDVIQVQADQLVRPQLYGGMQPHVVCVAVQHLTSSSKPCMQQKPSDRKAANSDTALDAVMPAAAAMHQGSTAVCKPPKATHSVHGELCHQHDIDELARRVQKRCVAWIQKPDA